MKKTISIVMSVAAVVFGVVFAVSGINTISEKDLYDTQITAEVVDVQEEWESSADPDEADRLVNTAYIDYEFDGKKHEHVPAPEQDDNIKVGDTVDILVQSKNPEKISGLNPTKGGVIFIVLGILVAIAGCVSSVRLFIKKR
ncbi:MAG: hypothetical protein IJR33_08345 [Clostridia bacterium]|nr:hypothetical protein [Clostridia bacterium]